MKHHIRTNWIKPGVIIRHPRYGQGTICSYPYKTPQPRARVVFADATRTVVINSRFQWAGVQLGGING